jgi:broad-specificity NMP kinase
MSYYVLIRGPAGVGKSTISALLAPKINASVTYFDKVLEELGIDDIVDNKWIPLDRFLKADEIVLPKVKHELETGRNAILDGNFYHLEQIDDLMSKLPFPHAEFTLKANLDECIKRDRTRKNVLGKQNTEAVFRLVSAFDYGNIIQTNNKTPNEVVDEIIRVLDATLQRPNSH